MKSYVYVHTIDGRLGHYWPGEQICFAARTRPVPTVENLETIKREQRASRRWRLKQQMSLHREYGWMKVLRPTT